MSLSARTTASEASPASADYQVIETEPEFGFEQITGLAAKLLNVPMAVVSFVEAGRQFCRADDQFLISGMPPLASAAHDSLNDELVIVPDTSADERLTDHPIVAGPPYVRFYAGAPLITREGITLGALCLMDTSPRTISESEVDTLNRLAAIVMESIEVRLGRQRLQRENAVHEQTARALRVVEARYRRISENTPGMVFQLVRRADGTGEFLFASDACRTILGLESNTLLGDAGEYFKLIHPKDRPSCERAMAAAVHQGTPLRWEGRHRLANGQLKWLQVSAQPERTPGGDVLWDGVMLDTTERRKAENRLRMLESSIENANDAILVTEAEPFNLPGPRIIYANRVFTKMSGYSLGEVLGQTPRMFQGPKTDPEARRKIRAALEAWQPIRIEVLNYRKDGSEFWVELNIVPVANEKGWYTHWVSVQREMSERKEAERVLEAARDEAQRANAAKSEFLSRMSHELRTPLNAILGFSQLLEMSNPSPKQRENIGQVLRGGRHLLNLINEVLDISRIEAGRLEFVVEPVKVARVLEEAVSLVRPLATQRDITLKINRAERSLDGVMVEADRQRLKQVLLNLLSNAIKYNHQGGRVDLICERASAGGCLRLSVRDTGPGISTKDLPRLFLPFERLGVNQSEVEGTGIGLAISKRLAGAMGGTISVESAEGQGSTFSLELPISAGSSQPVDEPGVQAPLSAVEASSEPVTHTVLHIEDNPSNLNLVAEILALRSQVTLISTMQGRSGLDMAREHHPDLILLDVHLPHLAGDVLLRELKDDPRTREIPVVMVSADATPLRIQRLLDLGAKAYLTKPLEVPMFLHTVDNALHL